MSTLNEMMALMSDTPMSAGGVYLLPGDYKLKVREVKNGKAESQGWDFFLAEMEVVESTNPDRPAGMVVEWMVAFKNAQYAKTYVGNVKNFLWAVFNGFDPSVQPEAITDKVWALATSEGQPLRGKTVQCSAVDKAKKHTPNENFTRITFQPWTPPPAIQSVA